MPTAYQQNEMGRGWNRLGLKLRHRHRSNSRVTCLRVTPKREQASTLPLSMLAKRGKACLLCWPLEAKLKTPGVAWLVLIVEFADNQ